MLITVTLESIFLSDADELQQCYSTVRKCLCF